MRSKIISQEDYIYTHIHTHIHIFQILRMMEDQTNPLKQSIEESL